MDMVWMQIAPILHVEKAQLIKPVDLVCTWFILVLHTGKPCLKAYISLSNVCIGECSKDYTKISTIMNKKQ